ncbi:MAG: pesticin C-terminus-like muramidase [Treponema sp.]|nr:pesticin C-terminus-like muramidase [Treponema sp.]
MIHKDFIEAVLARFEGKAIARGYIPCQKGTYYGTGEDKGEPLGMSGVTVATGVDLGQQTASGLKAMGVSNATLTVLQPYIGLRKLQALARLREAPFTLTSEQVAEIDHAVHNRYINQAAVLFGREAFEAAPKEVQAVAVSLHYQFGTPSRAASPALAKAWEAMQTGDYPKAANCLRNGDLWSEAHRMYMGRRRAEAAILEAVCEA